ncbi:hypothetical protein, partial [Methylobacterium sp. J-067]|uniref:hypothetical protein n=1 Tax=Methylobacterium sp. J-067 TaxID=2836648 RepID=UPI001FB8663D
TGLALDRSLRPLAILLRVMMPEMDGWSGLATLKAAPETAGIPRGHGQLRHGRGVKRLARRG